MGSVFSAPEFPSCFQLRRTTNFDDLTQVSWDYFPVYTWLIFDQLWGWMREEDAGRRLVIYLVSPLPLFQKIEFNLWPVYFGFIEFTLIDTDLPSPIWVHLSERSGPLRDSLLCQVWNLASLSLHQVREFYRRARVGWSNRSKTARETLYVLSLANRSC